MGPGENGTGPVRLLIADDSPTVRTVIRAMIEAEPGIAVVGEAADGAEAVVLAGRLRPDVVLMDIRMPVMDGREATERIMASRAVPIVVFSSLVRDGEARASIDLLAAGAIDVMAKPDLSEPPAVAACARELRRKIRLAARVQVVRHLRGRVVARSDPPPGSVSARGGGFAVVGIGASAGGPAALREILAALPPAFPLPLLVVQHLTPGFAKGFLEWLGRDSPLPVRTARHGEKAPPGTVLFAPEGRQMELLGDGTVRADSASPRGHHLPSADVLLASLAVAYGPRAVGILLTGMGADGAEGLEALSRAGGLTVAQSEESCAVFGMPGEAIRRGAARTVLAPAAIGTLLSDVAGPGGREVRHA